MVLDDMPEKLFIINLEDNRNDAELIQETLISEGIACEVRRVETRDDFLAAIANEDVDLILADYTLPTFDGLAALALAGERCPDVPFIFVTGTMGEEIAVEALKHGATDYVLKQHLARLGPVVRRALREAEARRELKGVEETMTWLASFPELDPNPIVEIDSNGKVHYLNSAARQLFPDLFMLGPGHPYLCDLGAVLEVFQQGERISTVRDVMLGQVCYQQSMYYVAASAHVRIYGLDITERKRAEEALRESEHRFRQIAETIHDVFWMTTPASGKMIYISPAYERIWQRELADLSAHPQEWADAIHPDDIAQVRANWEKQRSGFITAEEFRIRRIDGTIRWIANRAYPILDNAGEVIRVTGLAEDITERKQAEEQIRTALAEKETLLRELYHRTKNNMQVIRAMLILQAAHHPDAPLASFVQTIEYKIHTMALVHEKLYQAHDLSHVNLQEYIADLTRLLRQSYQVSGDKIALRLDLADVFVLIDTAIPCGLMLNELMANVFAHAFPDGRPGEIRISLRRTAAGEIELDFADNGVGVPAGFDFRSQPTLGLQTIFAIGERQMKGTVRFETQHGLTCHLRFKDNLYHARV